jgi:polar amino acid transport system substrate-binding protein
MHCPDRQQDGRNEYENPARYNESLGKDEWDVGLAARDPSRAEHLAFSEMFMEVDNGYVGRPGLPLRTAT